MKTIIKFREIQREGQKFFEYKVVHNDLSETFQLKEDQKHLAMGFAKEVLHKLMVKAYSQNLKDLGDIEFSDQWD